MANDLARSGARIGLVVLICAIFMVILGRILNPVIRIAVREQMVNEPEVEIQKRIATLHNVTYRTTLFVVLAIALITILPEFGIDAAALIAGLGLVGLAVGFGAQNLVKDIINGVFILTENQYGVGDVVTVADSTGVVEDINLRRTVLRDLDGTVHFIPHSQVTIASNWTKSYSRVNLNIRVSYEEDVDTVIDLINDVGKEMAVDPHFEGKILDPPHVLRVDNFTDMGVDIKITGETAPIEQWEVMGELRLRLKRAFDERGIDMPRIVGVPPTLAEVETNRRRSQPTQDQPVES
jgi:moderate conductance mechanosensitive channel